MKNKKKGERNEKRKETVRSEKNWGEKKEVKNNEERKEKGTEWRKKGVRNEVERMEKCKEWSKAKKWKKHKDRRS